MKQTLLSALLLMALAFTADAQKAVLASNAPKPGEDLFTGIYNGYARALAAKPEAPILKQGQYRMWKSDIQVVSTDSNMISQQVIFRTYFVAVSADTVLIYGDGKLQILTVTDQSICANEAHSDYYSYREFAGVVKPYNWLYFAKYSEAERRLSLSMTWSVKGNPCWANLTFCFANDKNPIVENLTAQQAVDVMYLASQKASGIQPVEVAGTR